MFTRWLERNKRTRADELKWLKVGTVKKSECVYVRRAMSSEEFSELVLHVEKAGESFGMSGMDRAMLYRLATGLRSSELASLTPKSFDLTTDESAVNVMAAYSKRKRDDEQPMPDELAVLQETWLKGKPKGAPVFAMPPTYEVAEMLRRDLKAARAAWLARDQGPDQEKREKSDFLKTPDAEGRLLDFHGLRHSYVSWLVNSGAPVSVCQALARHSTPMLTLAVYAQVQLADTKKAL